MSLMKNSAGPSKRPMKIHLYEDKSAKTLDLKEISRYLSEKLGRVSVDVREPLITAHAGGIVGELATRLADAKIRDPMKKHIAFEPLPSEINLERKLLDHPELSFPGVLYDGLRLMELALEMIPEEERDTGHLHLVFTSRLFGTWDEADARYHARVSVYSFPSLISTTGIVEAPAKPKEFYALKQRYSSLGAPVPYEELKEKFRGRFIDYDDERLTEVMKGYAMQAVFYHIFGEPFCDEITCRLHNGHWQEEVIRSQLGPKDSEFCENHYKMLEKFRTS
ncbi:MAG: DUF6775 family putative metallopeptidase [Methanobacteriota archaeon]